MNESEAYESETGMPDTIKDIFATKDGPHKMNASIFTKNRGETTNTSNVEADKMNKAAAIFDKHCIFNSTPLNAKELKPMNSAKLD